MKRLIFLLILLLATKLPAQITFIPNWSGLIDGTEIVDGSIDSIEVGVLGQVNIPDTLALAWIVDPGSGIAIGDTTGHFYVRNNFLPEYDDTTYIGESALCIKYIYVYRTIFKALTAAPTASLEAGMVYFNSTTGNLMVYDGSSWDQLTN